MRIYLIAFFIKNSGDERNNYEKQRLCWEGFGNLVIS